MNKRKHIKWDENSGPADNARHHLPALVADYFARVRETIGGQASASEMHALRLLTKRLRYTLELFRPCYGPGLRVRLAALRQLQQCLGEMNDCAAAARMLAGYVKKNSIQQRQLDQFLAQRGFERAAEFRRIWTQEFDAPGKQQWWIRYLARHVRPAPGKR
jgi:CHAD domain-containing protein